MTAVLAKCSLKAEAIANSSVKVVLLIVMEVIRLLFEFLPESSLNILDNLLESLVIFYEASIVTSLGFLHCFRLPGFLDVCRHRVFFPFCSVSSVYKFQDFVS